MTIINVLLWFCLQPLAAAVLSLFVYRGVRVEVRMDRLTALLESLLSSPEEVQEVIC